MKDYKYAIRFNDVERPRVFDPEVDDVWLGADDLYINDLEGTCCGSYKKDRLLFNNRDNARDLMQIMNRHLEVDEVPYCKLVRVPVK